MPKSFYSFAEIVKKEPALAGLRKNLNESDVVNEFKDIFPDLQKVATAVKVNKKTLYLSVENASWRSELKFKDMLIIEKINEHFKEERIKWIRFL
ncbi:MAG: DUF721 domain-containing protein [Ignavibacteriaceae bacterium]